MKTLTAIITTAAVLVAVSCRMPERTSESDIIPQPNSCEFDGRFCDISSLNGISADMGLENECRKLRDALEGAGLAKKIVRRGDIRLKIDFGLKDDEAYRLKVEPGRITISGGTQAGIFYGIVSLYQEMNAGKVRCGRIYDSPRFGWRGLMLDEARHFFGEEKVRQILDLMAYYKLNRFHWHLTDAQGWRLEIRKYPLLTEVGGIGTHSDRNAPAQFYTQEQVRKIVEYAKERHIEIIPLQLPVLLARLFCAQNKTHSTSFTFLLSVLNCLIMHKGQHQTVLLCTKTSIKLSYYDKNSYFNHLIMTKTALQITLL